MFDDVEAYRWNIGYRTDHKSTPPIPVRFAAEVRASRSDFMDRRAKRADQYTQYQSPARDRQ